MYGSILPLMRMAGFGRKRRRGGRKMLIQGSGRRRRRTGMRRRGGRRTRRQRGRGIFDTIKNIGSKAFNLARSVPIISTGLKLAGQDKYADTARSLGFGRRKRRTRRYGGRMSVYGGRRRATKRRFSVFGGRRKRRYRRKRRMGGRKRKMRGGLLSTMLRGLLGGRRKRRTHRRKRHHKRRHRMGGRRRTYRVGLFSRRR